MVTAARARHVLQEGKIAVRRAARASTNSPSHNAGTLTSKDVTPREMALLVAQGSTVALAILTVLGGIWFFAGDHLRARFAPLDTMPGAAAKGPAAPGPTVFYRDRGDGTVLVMEIDGNGTRLRGSINRADVPMLQEVHTLRNKWNVEAGSANNRMNALGSSFR